MAWEVNGVVHGQTGTMEAANRRFCSGETSFYLQLQSPSKRQMTNTRWSASRREDRARKHRFTKERFEV